MVYGWHTEAEALAHAQWSNYSQFKRVLASLQFLNISVQKNRDEALEMLRTIPTKLPPFSKDNRFPEEGLFVNMDHPFVANRLQTIAAALMFKDRAGEKGRQSYESVEKHMLSSAEDGRVAYEHALTELMSITQRGAIEDLYTFGLFTRTSLEKVYSLTWTG